MNDGHQLMGFSVAIPFGLVTESKKGHRLTSAEVWWCGGKEISGIM
jgi:hypothetical protein